MANGYYSSDPGRRRTAWWLPLLLIALFLIVAAGAGAYFWQQRIIDQRNATISDLKVQLLKAQSQPSTANPPAGQSQQQSSQAPTTTPSTTTTGASYTSTKGVKIILYHPTSGAKVSSPVAVIGEAPGNWSSEASFPVQLKDSTGKVIATTTGHVLGDWVTTSLVPFSASLTYSGTPSGSGTLVLQKDNPSGQSSNDDQVSIPISF